MDKEKIIAEAKGKAWEIIGHHRYKTDLVAREIAEALLPIIEKAVREDIIRKLANHPRICLDFSDEREFCAKFATCEECFDFALRSSGKEGERK